MPRLDTKRAFISLTCLMLTACANPSVPVQTLVPGPAATLYGVTTVNSLIRFQGNSASNLITTLRFSGLPAGEAITALDFRPADGKLYGLGSSSRVYVIDPSTGMATGLATPGPYPPALADVAFGFDVDPVTDLLRVVSPTQHARLRPDTGETVNANSGPEGLQFDPPLAFAATDANAGAAPAVVALAYSNPDTNDATSTTAYAIDAAQDVLVTVGTGEGATTSVSADVGTLYTVGPLGTDASGRVSFDIGPDGTAVAVMTRGSGLSQLYQIDLTTGAAALIGPIGSADTVRAIAITP
jgi:hypothetical protein